MRQGGEGGEEGLCVVAVDEDPIRMSVPSRHGKNKKSKKAKQRTDGLPPIGVATSAMISNRQASHEKDQAEHQLE